MSLSKVTYRDLAKTTYPTQTSCLRVAFSLCLNQKRCSADGPVEVEISERGPRVNKEYEEMEK